MPYKLTRLSRVIASKLASLVMLIRDMLDMDSETAGPPVAVAASLRS